MSGGIGGPVPIPHEALLVQQVEDQRAEIARLRKLNDRLFDALIWSSGCDDFQEDGKARKGWLKLCKPLLDKLGRGGDGS